MDKLRRETRITQYVLRMTLGLIVLVGVACQSTSASPNELRLTGVIEGTQVEVVAEVSARVVTIAAAEGERVNAGDIVVTLDEASLAVQVKQAEAAVSAAQANLAQVKAGARQEAIDAVAAAVKQPRPSVTARR